MDPTPYDEAQVTELLYQALETEIGGERVYERALDAVQDDDLKREWQKYLDETRQHQVILVELLETLGIDPEVRTEGRDLVAELCNALVTLIGDAIEGGDPIASELVATECVVLAETKDHLNWELIGYVATRGHGPWTEALARACEAVEPQEAHHLYHTKGFARELWLQSLGLPAALPPPEEVKHVDTAIAAARAEQSRDERASTH